MQIITLQTRILSVNTYIVYADGSNTCFVVDPGDAAQVLTALAETQLSCTHILITHGHFDHIGGLLALRDATRATVCIHEKDAIMLFNNRENLSVLIGMLLPAMHADLLLHDGDTLSAGGTQINVLHTPGHSEGGVCYVLASERIIFSGDTVFLDGVGRTDFPRCSQKTLYHSIHDKLFALPGNYTIYPGHGEPTDMDHERMHNPLVQVGEQLNW